MRIAGVQKLTLLDFPGHTAATVFTPGCDLRCPFCHNSDLVNDDLEEEYYANEVLAFLETRVGKLDGVAFTGGEPLMQEGLDEFVKLVKRLGFKIKLDTNGTFPDKLDMMLKKHLVDYVAMDIKNAPSLWPQTVGLDPSVAGMIFARTLRSMDIIKSSGVEYEFRTTIVKGLHTPETMDELGRFVSGAEHYYLQNFTDSGAILGESCSAWDKETLLSMLETIRKYVPNAELRGVD